MSKYCILVDLGTTTIAMAVYDADSDHISNTTVFENPQTSYGADVISRIESQISGSGDKLRDLVRDAIYDQSVLLCRKSAIDISDIDRVYIAGNTTMIHLLMGYDCTPLSKSPFKPELSSPDEIHTYRGLDINISIVPWASAFIGGDIVSGLYYIDLSDEKYNNYLLIDLGTNGEMVLSKNSELYATATAAGPAFEGGGLTCGVAGVPGAISSVRLNKLKPTLTTIDNALPIGICGAGAVSMMSELLEKKYINPDSSLSDIFPEYGITLSAHSATDDKHPIVFTADDIYRILLAKAAIAAGIDTLLKASSTHHSDIDKVYLAGGLGYHIDLESSDNIRLFSDLSTDIITPVGNTSLMGLSKLARSDSGARIPVPNMHIINLGTSSYFKNKFIEHCSLNR